MNRELKLGLIIILLAGLLIGANAIGNPACSGHLRHDKEVKINGKTIFLQTAMTAADQEKGLGGLSCIARNEGMIFEFDQAGFYRFWMKDTHFPLDIIWLSSDKKVITELQAIQPSSYPQTYTSEQPAKYVLELNSGEAARINLSAGQQIHF